MSSDILRQSLELLSVVEKVEKMVFYEARGWNVMVIPFDETGDDGLCRRQGDKERTELERFVREKDNEFWAWVHPRKR